MSCALWRLHESIHRNDSNQLFLLSSESEIRAVAQKLNITVRSAEEIKHLVATKTNKTGIESCGDLEREFGVQLKSAKSPVAGPIPPNGEDSCVSEKDEDVTKHNEKMNESMSHGKTAELDDSNLTDEDPDAILEKSGKDLDCKDLEKKSLSMAGDGIEKMEPEDALDEPPVALVEADASKHSAWTKSPVSSTPTTYIGDVEKRFETTRLDSGMNSNETSRISSRTAIGPEARKNPEISPISYSGPRPSASITYDEKPCSDVPNTQPAPKQAMAELEDSDEEEIVFKPQAKRYSAQKKPAQQSALPSTPKTQPSQNAKSRSPQLSMPKPPPQPKQASHGRNPMVVGHGHPRPSSSPTVIDPDAFGRNFAVNTNPSPRTPHNSRAHHHPRPNSQNSQAPQAPRSPRRQNGRTSPPRQPQENIKRPSPPAEPRAEPTLRMSPRQRSGAMQLKNPALGTAESSASSQGVQRQPKLPAPKQFETDDFLPRPPRSNAILPDTRPTPSMNRSKDYQTADFVPRSQMTQTPPNAAAASPNDFEPSEFVPRSAASAALYKPRGPEPDYIEPRASMPDVEYVLKSGSTRASARGRGRLWTPS